MSAPGVIGSALHGAAASAFGCIIISRFFVRKGADRQEMGIAGTVIIPGGGRSLGDISHPVAFAAPEQFKLKKAVRYQVKGMSG